MQIQAPLTKVEMKESTANFYFPVFSTYEVHVILTDNVMDSRRLRDCYLGPSDSERPPRALCESRPGHSWLFIHNKADQGTIAHESFHCVFALLNFIGARLDNEIVAYHLQYVVNQVNDLFLKGLQKSS